MSAHESSDRPARSTVISDAISAEQLVLAHEDHTAIASSTFSVQRSTTVAFIGPNGSGKSTLLDAICGLVRPRAGRLEVMGLVPGRASAAYVLQGTETPATLPLTVREVVTMGRYRSTGLWGRLGTAGREAVDEAMIRTGIEDLASAQLLELSGGQRQRALIAQGLAARADLLVLDEPMTGLDLVSRRRVLDVMDEERGRGATVVFSTHDMSEAAGADQVVLLAGGVVASGDPGTVLTRQNLRIAYEGQIVDAGDLLLDDPHHHGARADRHDGHVH